MERRCKDEGQRLQARLDTLQDTLAANFVPKHMGLGGSGYAAWTGLITSEQNFLITIVDHDLVDVDDVWEPIAQESVDFRQFLTAQRLMQLIGQRCQRSPNHGFNTLGQKLLVQQLHVMANPDEAVMVQQIHRANVDDDFLSHAASLANFFISRASGLARNTKPG